MKHFGLLSNEDEVNVYTNNKAFMRKGIKQ